MSVTVLQDVQIPSAAVSRPSINLTLQDESSTANLTRTISKNRAEPLGGARPPTQQFETDEVQQVSRGRSAAVIASVTFVTALGSVLAGILTVSIPVIARELKMDSSLELW